MKKLLLLVSVVALTGCPSHEAQHAAMAARANMANVSSDDSDDLSPVKANSGEHVTGSHND